MSGVAYTIVLMAPFLYLVYPVLGFTILGVVLGLVFLFINTPLPIGLELIVGLILGVMSFFLGYKLEARASQYKVYRFVRGAFRSVNFFVVPAILLSFDRLTGPDSLELNSAASRAFFRERLDTGKVTSTMRPC